MGHSTDTRYAMSLSQPKMSPAARRKEVCPYGSAISRSVSFTILFGNAMMSVLIGGAAKG